jgi:hypothetical protein
MSSSTPPTASGVRTTWIVIGVVLVVAVPGALALAWSSSPPSVARPTTIVVTLAGSPLYSSIVCPPAAPETFETFFQVGSVSSPLLTSEFSLSILTSSGVPISSNGSAPRPSANLPCSAPNPTGWYVFLSRGDSGAIATYPTAGSGVGPPTWSNASRAPATIVANDQFVFVTVADFTGTGDTIVSTGVGSASVLLAGNTTFPPFQNP